MDPANMASKALPIAEKIMPDTIKENKNERNQMANKISQVMSDLKFNASRYLDIRLIGNKKGLDKKLLDAFDDALRIQEQFKYLIPEYLQDAIKEFMDATYENIQYWKRRWEVEQGYARVGLSYNETKRELPNIDQIRGRSGKAFDELQKSLKKYKQGFLKHSLVRLVIRLETASVVSLPRFARLLGIVHSSVSSALVISKVRRRLTSPRSL